MKKKRLSSILDIEELADVIKRLEKDTDYARGVLDLLLMLGIVEPDGTANKLKPRGDVTEMMLGSLRAHLADGQRVGFDWNDLNGHDIRGVDLLKEIETKRRAATKKPAPGRIVSVAMAIIKDCIDGEDVYLMEYDAYSGRYEPIGGKQDDSDTNTEYALRREMMEELGLEAIPLEDVCMMERIMYDWHTTEISATYGILTSYSMVFYVVTGVAFSLTENSDNVRWLRRKEMQEQKTSDGIAISSICQEALGWELLDALEITRYHD